LGKRLAELTGDHTPDLRALLAADLIIATPEKWDGVSRAWQTRGYVKRVGLVIIDEIHLLGADRCVFWAAVLFWFFWGGVLRRGRGLHTL
jgi:activating signal cointegrator complex subunit 3